MSDAIIWSLHSMVVLEKRRGLQEINTGTLTVQNLALPRRYKK